MVTYTEEKCAVVDINFMEAVFFINNILFLILICTIKNTNVIFNTDGWNRTL